MEAQTEIRRKGVKSVARSQNNFFVIAPTTLNHATNSSNMVIEHLDKVFVTKFETWVGSGSRIFF